MMEDNNSLGTKPRLEYHSPDVLIVDDRYQRSIETARGRSLIKKIVGEFYWPFFGVLIATDNGDGTYCLIDGQHRAAAARKHPEIHSVPVMVIDEMSLVDQARAFVEINRNRARLNKLQIHRASVRAGDPDAVRLDELCRKSGVRFYNNAPTQSTLRPGYTMTVGALETILRKHGDDVLSLVLETVMAAYGETTGDLRAGIFRAVAIAVGSNPDLAKKITETLQQKDAVSWLEEARCQAKVKGISTNDALAEILSGGLWRSS